MTQKSWAGWKTIIGVGLVVVATNHLLRDENPAPASPAASAPDGKTPERLAEEQEHPEHFSARAGVASTVPAQATKLWYKGGTLHKAGALDWQNADQANKLATAADLIAALWDKGRLKPAFAARLHGVDDLRAPAQELVVALDKALSKESDHMKNEQLYKNTDVAGAAVLAMGLMGWI